VGPVTAPILELIGKVANRLCQAILGRRYRFYSSPLIGAAYGRTITRLMNKDPCDILVVAGFSQAIPFLTTDIPIVYVSDATQKLMVGYYENFSNLCQWSLRDGEDLQRRAIRGSQLVVYPSSWAAKSAHEDYQADKEKLLVLPYGANIEVDPEARLRTHPTSVQLLFLGYDWERKGGSVAVEVLHILRSHGLDVSLTICGCNPPEVEGQDGVTVIPRIDKNTAEGREEFDALLYSSTFLLLPTKRECFGIVFCEAAAYGLPSVSSATGGVPSAIHDGVNGLLLPISASATDFADRIMDCLGTPGAYEELTRTSRKDYEARLSWDSWGRAIAPRLEALGERRNP
jgi:glycosyltransferase involved in cell wall biosynthesis